MVFFCFVSLSNCSRVVKRNTFSTHPMLSIICTHILKHSMFYDLPGLLESCCSLFLFRYATKRYFQPVPILQHFCIFKFIDCITYSWITATSYHSRPIPVIYICIIKRERVAISTLKSRCTKPWKKPRMSNEIALSTNDIEYLAANLYYPNI